MVDTNQLKGPDLGSRAEAQGDRQLDERLVDAVREGDTATIRSLMVTPSAVVLDLFSQYADQLTQYHESLATIAAVRGIVGPREVPRLWDRHILNCVSVAELMPKNAKVVDIGSGAGLPGVPLAIVRPDLDVTLIESAKRRSDYLLETATALGLKLRVLRGRAEHKDIISTAGGADVVTSRAVAPLGRLAEWSLPLLRAGGQILAMKGDSAQEEVERDAQLVRKLGGINARVLKVFPDYLSEPTFVVSIDKR